MVRWLVDGVPGAKTPVDVLARLLPELALAGIPLWGTEAFVRTLHPHIVGRRFRWMGFAPAVVEVHELSYVEVNAPDFQNCAVAQTFQGHALRVRLPADLERFPEYAGLTPYGATEVYSAPMRFISGQTHAIAFITTREGGFEEQDIAAFDEIVPPLSRVGEIFALLRTATNLLNTYVGHDAGERILQGQIRRGDTTLLDSVIWFSDLRGFTSLSATLQPRDIIAVLNDLFECQIPAITRHGGQVLKFIGDGLLAVFPIASPEQRSARCDDALAAAKEAFAALDALNASGTNAIRFGLALHVGQVAYGNIGAAGRLDFTCIGAEVNLAARLETLTGKLDRNIVVSSELAAATSAKVEPLGTFELKGIALPIRAFGPA
jgi:adenylate cyclase